jgi:hypothetical protein
MTRRKALERRETKAGNCEVTPQAVWPIKNSLMKRDGPKAPTAVHGPLAITYHPNMEAEEPTAWEAVTRRQPLKIQQTETTSQVL